MGASQPTDDLAGKTHTAHQEPPPQFASSTLIPAMPSREKKWQTDDYLEMLSYAFSIWMD
jgi:hypothetical protein